MKKAILLGCLMTAGVAPFFAQPADSVDLGNEIPEAHGCRDIAGGVRFLFFDFDRMNHTLEQAGLPDAEPLAQGGFVAFRLHAPKSRWATESSMEFLWSGSEPSRVNNSAVLYRDYSINLRLLYDISHGKRLTKLFPFVGVGFALQHLRTYENLPGGGSFVLAIANEVRKNKFSSTAIPLEAGLSLEQGFRTRIYNIYIGLRGGYMFRALPSDWALDGDIVVDLPQPAAGTPFAAISIRIQANPERIREFTDKQIQQQ